MNNDSTFKYCWLAKNYWALWGAGLFVALMTWYLVASITIDTNRFTVTLAMSVLLSAWYWFIDKAHRHLYEDIVLFGSGIKVSKRGKPFEIHWSEIVSIEEFPSLKTSSVFSYKKVDPDWVLGSTGVRLHMKNGEYFPIYRKISNYKKLIDIINSNVKKI